MTVHAIIVAAGSGTRFGGNTPKALVELDGRSLLAHAGGAAQASGVVDNIVLVMPQTGDIGANPEAKVVRGGTTRAESVRKGLEALDGSDDDLILVHDAARPLVAPDSFAAVVAALEHADAVTVAVPAADTLLEVEDGLVASVPNRSRMYRAQTPQGFRLGVLRTAHGLAAADKDFVATDDCGVVRRYLPDVTIAIVQGSDRNLKITTPADLALAELLLADSEQPERG